MNIIEKMQMNNSPVLIRNRKFFKKFNKKIEIEVNKSNHFSFATSRNNLVARFSTDMKYYIESEPTEAKNENT